MPAIKSYLYFAMGAILVQRFSLYADVFILGEENMSVCLSLLLNIVFLIIPQTAIICDSSWWWDFLQSSLSLCKPIISIHTYSSYHIYHVPLSSPLCQHHSVVLPQILDVRNVLVVVSRWYGGILLGPDRFKHINNSARNILVQEGYTSSAVRPSFLISNVSKFGISPQ